MKEASGGSTEADQRELLVLRNSYYDTKCTNNFSNILFKNRCKVRFKFCSTEEDGGGGSGCVRDEISLWLKEMKLHMFYRTF